MDRQPKGGVEREIAIPVRAATLTGNLTLPANSSSMVVFAHGSGSSRHSPRNKFVAEELHRARVGTLLFDLLTYDEEASDAFTRAYRFDIAFLAERLLDATRRIDSQPEFNDLRIGYFGASTGSAAAIVAAAALGERVGALVSRGGRPDLASAETLRKVKCPTLFIVGGDDDVVLELNQQAFEHLACEKRLVIVPGATHLFEEPGALEKVARLATDWFVLHLRTSVTQS